MIHILRHLVVGLVFCPLAAAAEEGAGALDLEALAERAAPLEEIAPHAAQDEVRDATQRLAEGAERVGPFSFGGFDHNAPVVIRADELEATEQDGRRVLVFRRNVEVSQADLTLRAARLSAIYPEGSKQPTRLEADGGVVVREGDRDAHCKRVIYDRLGQTLDCLGGAALRDGKDRISGDSIRFDLARRSVAIGGGTEVSFEPRPQEGAKGDEESEVALPVGSLPLLREQAPVLVKALGLEASDGEEGRRVAFEGDVELSQQGTRLRAQRLEAVYPPGGDQPDRLIASGDVLLAEGIREATCERAEYLRLENRVRCEGGVARAGDDRLEGDLIDFALGEEKLSVRGRTRLVLAPREPGSATP